MLTEQLNLSIGLTIFVQIIILSIIISSVLKSVFHTRLYLYLDRKYRVPEDFFTYIFAAILSINFEIDLVGAILYQDLTYLGMILTAAFLAAFSKLFLNISPKLFKGLVKATANNFEEKTEENDSNSTQKKPRLVSIEVPEAPIELVQSLASKNCVLFSGSQLAASIGYPTLKELLSKFTEIPEYSSVKPMISSGHLEDAAEVLGSLVNESEIQSILQFMYKPKSSSSNLHKLLRSIPFRSAITVSWDRVLDEALSEKRVVSQDPQDFLSLKEHYDSAVQESFVIHKLYGDIDHPASLILSPAEVISQVARNRTMQRSISADFSSRSFFFCGVTLEEIEHFLKTFDIKDRGKFPHFALVADELHVEVKRKFFNKYGIELLVFNSSSQGLAYNTFLERLLNQLPKEKTSYSISNQLSDRILTKLHLENIGPFENLDVSFHDKWNVFLGNNGCGKSTILKAIAVALSGEDARIHEAATKLLKSGEKKGRIQLLVGDEMYETFLKRVGSRIEVEATKATPLESGQWPVFAFPPLRGYSNTKISGPNNENELGPDVEDVLPLLNGGADSRMGSLKQWIVNNDGRSKNNDLDLESRDRANNLLDSFFTLMQALTPGVVFGRGKVDNDYKVWVNTSDGEVPIDLISQGMSSIVGWAGYTLQRLAAIYSDKADPESHSALVLVDELDAHMHPHWQMKIASSMQSHFKNLQVIATTHSPLIVGNLDKEQLFLVVRDSNSVKIERPKDSFKGWRVDQILTSPAFDLPGTRDLNTNQELDEYLELGSKLNLTKHEEERLKSLAKNLNTNLPSTQSLESGIQAYEILEKSIKSHIETMPEQRREKILREIRLQLKGFPTEPNVK